MAGKQMEAEQIVSIYTKPILLTRFYVSVQTQCRVSDPVPLPGPQGPVNAQFVAVNVSPSVENVPLAVTLFVVTASVYVRLKLPPVTCEFAMFTGLLKQGLFGKVAVPLS